MAATSGTPRTPTLTHKLTSPTATYAGNSTQQWSRRHLWAAPNPSLLARHVVVSPSQPRSLNAASKTGSSVVVMQAALSHPELCTLWDHQIKGQVGK